MLEEQLEQERRRTTLDFSDRDDKMKSEHYCPALFCTKLTSTALSPYCITSLHWTALLNPCAHRTFYTGEYEKVLSSELKVLRRKYRQETERTKQEFLNLHSNKVGLF